MSFEVPAESTNADLTDAIGQLHGVMACAHAHLLAVAAAYEGRQAHFDDGARNMAEWLVAQLGISYTTAKAWTRVAHGLGRLPLLAGAFEEGRLSFEQVRLLVKLQDRHEDAELVELGTSRSVAELQAMAQRREPPVYGEDMTARDRRRLWWRPSEDQLSVQGGFDLPAADAMRVIKSVEAVAESLPAHAESGERDPHEARCADALVLICSASLAEAKADRATVVIHADASFACDQDAAGSAELEEGPALSWSTLQRHLCDCHLETIVAQPDGSLGIGRKSRSIPRWLERRVRRRDHGCRFPGCGLSRWTQIHHMRHWKADLGPTDEGNLITVCLYHHHFLHEQHWKARGDPAGVIEFVNSQGRVIKAGPPALRPGTLAA
ncbi:MAG: hypothetical protein QOG87_2251 [Actinomycetota bacterium]|jgi:hypothetical protein